jgi:hypothetical protein
LKRPFAKRFPQHQRPEPSQNNNLIRLRDRLQKHTKLLRLRSSRQLSKIRHRRPDGVSKTDTINQRAQEAGDAPDFSQRIRAGLAGF